MDIEDYGWAISINKADFYYGDPEPPQLLFSLEDLPDQPFSELSWVRLDYNGKPVTRLERKGERGGETTVRAICSFNVAKFVFGENINIKHMSMDLEISAYKSVKEVVKRFFEKTEMTLESIPPVK